MDAQFIVGDLEACGVKAAPVFRDAVEHAPTSHIVHNTFDIVSNDRALPGCVGRVAGERLS